MMAPKGLYYWRREQGIWPRLVVWLGKHGSEWARETYCRAVDAEIEQEHVARLLTACVMTGEAMIGSVDDEGQFSIHEAQP